MAAIALPDLRTWVDAGAGGLDRAVSWAHVCELADPTEWLGAGELVLTTGLGIPKAPASQRRYVERLADAGLSGLALGHRMHAPPVSAEMRAAAEERDFPLLFTAYEVPFTAVVRAVAEANRSVSSTPACSRRCACTRPSATPPSAPRGRSC